MKVSEGRRQRRARDAIAYDVRALDTQQFPDGVDGVDLAPGNALLAKGLADEAPDARGTSWLRPGQRRSPAGNLYGCPLEPPALEQIGEWSYDGRLQLGWVVANGDEDNALWNRYVRWDSGLVLGLPSPYITLPYQQLAAFWG